MTRKKLSISLSDYAFRHIPTNCSNISNYVETHFLMGVDSAAADTQVLKQRISILMAENHEIKLENARLKRKVRRAKNTGRDIQELLPLINDFDKEQLKKYLLPRSKRGQLHQAFKEFTEVMNYDVTKDEFKAIIKHFDSLKDETEPEGGELDV